MIRLMERFSFASALKSNLSYYHIKMIMMLNIRIQLYSNEVNINTNPYPWVSSFLDPDNFQDAMSKLVQGMQYAKRTIHPIFMNSG
jgi:hypothetical protein